MATKDPIQKTSVEPWGAVLVQPLTHQVLKTNIRIDVVPNKSVIQGVDIALWSPQAALVCDKDGGGEYQFSSGVVVTKVQSRSNAITFKLYVNTISELKKETDALENIPLDPNSRKSRPRFWLRFFLGNYVPVNTTRFFLFIRRDEQRMHVQEMKYEESKKVKDQADEYDRTKRKAMDSAALPESVSKRVAVELEQRAPIPVVAPTGNTTTEGGLTQSLCWGGPFQPVSRYQSPFGMTVPLMKSTWQPQWSLATTLAMPTPIPVHLGTRQMGPMFGMGSANICNPHYVPLRSVVVAPVARAAHYKKTSKELALKLIRMPSSVQICTQVIKPHISVSIERSDLAGVRRGCLSVELIFSFQKRCSDSWDYVVVPIGLFYDTSQPLKNEDMGAGEVITFRCHVGGWTSIKKFIKENVQMDCTRDRTIKSNYGLRFTLTADDGRGGRKVVATEDYPRLFALDIRRENDPNYTAKPGRSREVRTVATSNGSIDTTKDSSREDESSVTTQDDDQGHNSASTE